MVCEKRNENCENDGNTRDGIAVFRSVVLVAEADQGVAPVVVMPAVPKTDRSRYVTKRDLVKYGYTDECQACTQLASGMHNAKVPHDDRCRDRIGELMASDDDQRQVERMMSRTTVDVENEIQCPETGEEVDVGETSVQPRSVDEDQPRPETQSVPRPVEEQPIPTVRVGWIIRLRNPIRRRFESK